LPSAVLTIGGSFSPLGFLRDDSCGALKLCAFATLKVFDCSATLTGKSLFGEEVGAALQHVVYPLGSLDTCLLGILLAWEVVLLVITARPLPQRCTLQGATARG
jgi:hypothetical protein